MKFWLSFPIIKPLHKSNNTLVVLYKAVRNFDGESYHRGNPKGFPLFLVAGGGLMSSVISTIHPNPPLKRRACGKALPCIALQSEWQLQSRGYIGWKFWYVVLTPPSALCKSRSKSAITSLFIVFLSALFYHHWLFYQIHFVKSKWIWYINDSLISASSKMQWQISFCLDIATINNHITQLN